MDAYVKPALLAVKEAAGEFCGAKARWEESEMAIFKKFKSGKKGGQAMSSEEEMRNKSEELYESLNCAHKTLKEKIAAANQVAYCARKVPKMPKSVLPPLGEWVIGAPAAMHGFFVACYPLPVPPVMSDAQKPKRGRPRSTEGTRASKKMEDFLAKLGHDVSRIVKKSYTLKDNCLYVCIKAVEFFSKLSPQEYGTIEQNLSKLRFKGGAECRKWVEETAHWLSMSNKRARRDLNSWAQTAKKELDAVVASLPEDNPADYPTLSPLLFQLMLAWRLSLQFPTITPKDCWSLWGGQGSWRHKGLSVRTVRPDTFRQYMYGTVRLPAMCIAT